MQGFIGQARSAGRGTSWLSYIVGPTAAITDADDYDDFDRLAAQTITNRIAAWKDTHEKAITEAKANLAQTRWQKYEAGLKTLGWFAGATEVFDNGGADAAPDSTWIFGDKLWVAWEAKSEATSDSSVSAKYTRRRAAICGSSPTNAKKNPCRLIHWLRHPTNGGRTRRSRGM